VSRGARALLAPGALVGALGSAGEDMRRHDTFAPAAMARSAAPPTTMGDGWTVRERAAQVTRTGTARPAMGGRARRGSLTSAR
jgi:hypothetical protein